MRITYVLPRFPVPSETFVAVEVDALRQLGHDIRVLAYGPPVHGSQSLLRQRGLSDVDVDHGAIAEHVAALVLCILHPLRTLHAVAFLARSSWSKPLSVLRGLPWIPRSVQLLGRVAEDGPDVVHLFWGHYPAILGDLVLTYAPDVVVTTSFGAYDFELDFGGGWHLARSADMVRSFARVNRSAILERGIDEARLFEEPQGIDLSLVRPSTVTSGEASLVSVGRLIPAKGMDDAVRTLARVRDHFPHATLRILGDGPERAGLERLARDLGLDEAVVFEGHVSQQRVYEALAASRVFLLLSRHRAERLPNVVKEAMASRCKCVVTRTPGIEELIPDSRFGQVLTEASPEEAAAVTIQILGTSPSSLEAELDLAEEWIRTRFDASGMARRLAARWQELLDRRGVRR